DAEWTILWYLAMDNNLYYQTAHELDDVAAAGLSPDVRVVALVDRLDETQGYYAEFGGGGFTPVVDLGRDVDTGDWTTLRDFGAWAVENYPAQHYALVIADHGGAWKSAAAGGGPPPYPAAKSSRRSTPSRRSSGGVRRLTTTYGSSAKS
ncbi:MAG: clostripain-related cysteine peptidase, partial [Myxococcota bacterium]|nr:clostripain-related cysteine peptidase [Myxococcota bacterium]